MNPSTFMLLLILVVRFSTSYSKITTEHLRKENEKESKTDGNIQNDSSNYDNSGFTTWHSETVSTLKENRTKQLIQRQRRNTIPELGDLLSDKHHQDKRSVLVFKQQVLEIQVPDNPLNGKQIPGKFKHKAKHHDNAVSGLNYLDLDHAQSTRNTNDVQQDNDDPFGNKLEKIHSDINKITVSKVSSPVQELPILDNSNGFLPYDPGQLSDSRNFGEYEPYNLENDRNNPIFSSQNEDYEEIQGSNRLIDEPHVSFPSEISNNNEFEKTNGHIPEVYPKYFNDNQENLSPSNSNGFMNNPHVLFPPEIDNNKDLEETNGHIPESLNPDESLNYFNGNHENLSPSDGNGFMDEQHVLSPAEISSSNQFDDTDKLMLNNFPDTKKHVSDVSLKYLNGYPESLNPSEEHIDNEFMENSHDPFHQKIGNNIPFKNTDKSSLNHFPEPNQNIQDMSLKFSNDDPERMIPPEHEISPHSHVGETVHEVFKKEEKIQEVDSQLGNKEVSREISRETSNTVSRQLSEDSKPISNPKLIASHSQEVPNAFMNFRPGDKNQEDNYLLNSPIRKNPEPFEQYEFSQNSPLVKRNDFENQRNHFLSANSYGRPSYNALSDSSIAKPLITRQSNLGEMRNLPIDLRRTKNQPTGLEEIENQPTGSEKIKNQPITLEEIKNFPIDLGKMKSHPADLGELKNYPYFNIRKDENKDGSNRKRLLEIFFPHDNLQRHESRYKKQSNFHDTDNSSIENFDKSKREGNHIERSTNSVRDSDTEISTSSSTVNSLMEKTEKRDSVKKRLADVAEPHNKKNLLYIRKRTVEILVPNIPSKNNETAKAELQKLQLSNPILNDNDSDENYPYLPNDQKYTESKFYENSDAFLVPQQSNALAAAPENLNFVQQNPNREDLNLFPGESLQMSMSGDQLNVPPQENFLTAEQYEDSIKRRETPMNVETIINQLLDTSSKKIKRNASPSPVNRAKVLRRKKKSHMAIHN